MQCVSGSSWQPVRHSLDTPGQNEVADVVGWDCRYGWTPEAYEVPAEPEFDWVRAFPAGRSITELEMARACLNAPGHGLATSVAESVFYMRSGEFLKDVPAELLPIFCDGETYRVAGSTRFNADKSKRKKLDGLITQVSFQGDVRRRGW